MRQPRVFYHAYDHQRPNGGQKDTYQHVDILNAAGYEAYAVHREPNTRLTWFENQTAVIDDRGFTAKFDPQRDFLVLPEDKPELVSAYPGRKVIFNKNVYNGFRLTAGIPAGRDPYKSQDVVAVMAVSEHNRKQLQFAYPHQTIYLVSYDLRIECFPYRPIEAKEPAIVFLPKNLPHVGAVEGMLRARAASGLNRLGRFEWIYLRNLSERQVAAALERAILFVFLSVDEGLPRAPLEAMACGCLVAAYGHSPLDEYLPAEYAFNCGDLAGIALAIERIADAYPNLHDLGALTARGRQIASRYSAEQQAATVLKAWSEIAR